MQGKLTFNLPEEEREFKQAVNAPQVLSDLGEFSEWMRSRLKYETLHEEQAAELSNVRDKFHEIMGPHFEE